MTVTAARLGSSPIHLDWSNAATHRGADLESFRLAWDALRARFDSGEVGFYRAPIDPSISHLDESERLARDLLASGRFTDCLFLGIGGSALGPASLLQALRERARSGIRFHFQDNTDAVDWRLTLRDLDPERTLVCVVTKSGTTFETIAQFLIALEWLGRERRRSHVVAITDPEKGDLRAFARQQEIPTLTIHPSIGGRFSIFSPVGLFAAALAGLDTRAFVEGARQVHDQMEKAPLEKNPLFALGAELIRQGDQRPIHVCMPYSTPLKSLGAWFVQLWGESLGKDGKGFTPVAAVGATDQHSILQLLRDGPDDKVTLFITVDEVGDECQVPRTVTGIDTSRFPSFGALQGHSLHELMQIEYRATSLVLTRRSRPHATFRLDRLDERNLGALYYAFSVLTAFTGTLMGVNPFDQPGVEEGKVYIRQALSENRGARDAEEDPNSPVNRLRREPRE